MKKSIFEDKNAESLIQRIGRLTNMSTPVWGKMSSGQMLAHCNVAYDGALGKKTLQKSGNFLFRTLVKWVVLSERPFARNLPTSPEFTISDPRVFEEEKTRLIQNIRDAVKYNLSGTWIPHPAFGKLTPAQWGWLLYKHTDHHLQQFGV